MDSEHARTIKSVGHVVLGLCLLTVMTFSDKPWNSALLAMLALLIVYRDMLPRFQMDSVLITSQAGLSVNHRKGTSVNNHSYRTCAATLGSDAGFFSATTPQAGNEPTVLGGRYRLDAEIGKGAMGNVFIARCLTDNRVVAIKTMDLNKHKTDGNELFPLARLFLSEAETAGRLHHRNIVEIYDAGEEHQVAYIVMELLTGQSLKSYTKTGTLLPPDDVVHIISICARALAHAHQQNIVHRDIKPANIMYDQETGGIKLTDFGIAHLTDAELSESGLVMGTPLYMSPEQLTGKPIDGRSDLFSLGGMLLHLLIGRPPFEATSLTELMGKIAKDKPASVALLRPEISVRLNAVIKRALEKNVGKRYQTGHEMADDLQKCLTGLRGYEYSHES